MGLIEKAQGCPSSGAAAQAAVPKEASTPQHFPTATGASPPQLPTDADTSAAAATAKGSPPPLAKGSPPLAAASPTADAAKTTPTAAGGAPAPPPPLAAASPTAATLAPLAAVALPPVGEEALKAAADARSRSPRLALRVLPSSLLLGPASSASSPPSLLSGGAASLLQRMQRVKVDNEMLQDELAKGSGTSHVTIPPSPHVFVYKFCFNVCCFHFTI